MEQNERTQAAVFSENGIPQFGISIKSLNYFLIGLTLVLSGVLLFATFRINHGYQENAENTDNYIYWRETAVKLRDGSDFLTEQVRQFTETGNREYLDAYIREANDGRTRENALVELKKIHGETDAYGELEQALEESDALMEREYYAMRLASDARGYSVSSLPEAVQRVELSEHDSALTRAEKEKLARSMVFDSVYQTEKNMISMHMESCLEALKADMDARHEALETELGYLLVWQKIIILLLIVISVSTMLLTVVLVIRPLLKAEQYIRAEQCIPVRGSEEFKFLARTYNLMFESHREQNEQLAYEATHDRLTGVYNRTGYDFLMENLDLWNAALLVMDVDKFKQINDTFGHEAGDRVLEQVAQVIRKSFRAQDYICRIGGDEFVVIMMNAGDSISSLIQEKVDRINRTLAVCMDGDSSPSISCGVAYGEECRHAAELFRHADEALYEVKRMGGHGCKVICVTPA
ncbi:MAG: GGDEF domain-containing protein [Solobacterium sp.]|nr:GGDEF domain-containing protein [Solobacterium sp.]